MTETKNRMRRERCQGCHVSLIVCDEFCDYAKGTGDSRNFGDELVIPRITQRPIKVSDELLAEAGSLTLRPIQSDKQLERGE